MDSVEKREEVRKIQVTGRGSYIVSLPKYWVKQRNLERREQIVFSIEDDGSLRITPRTKIKKKKFHETTIYVSENQDLESLTRKMIALYLMGFNFIRIKTSKERFGSEQTDNIRNFVRSKLVGTEVVTESPNEIALQVLISYPELTVENALRRMVIITLSMVKDAVMAFINVDKELALEILKMDNEVDRFGFYIVRQLKTASQDRSIIPHIGLTTGRDIIGYRLVGKSVERTADHAAKIATIVSQMRQPIMPKLAQKIDKMCKLSMDIFQEALTSLYRRDYDMAEDVVKKSKKNQTLEREIISDVMKQKLDPVQMSLLRLMIESLSRVGEYGSDIAEVVLNLTAVTTVDHIKS
ncbi:PhoU domain-containing protein [[Eubacterium] cellulosolvens]